MTVVHGDLRYGAAAMIEASEDSSIWRMLVLCRLHSRSFAFSASLCSLCHPTPRTGPRWLLLVLIEPPLESLLCFIPSPLSLPQPDTEFLNKMIQGSHLLVLSPDRGPWTIPQVPASSPTSKPESDPRLEHLVPLLSFLDATLCPQAVSPAKAFSACPCDIGGHGN